MDVGAEGSRHDDARANPQRVEELCCVMPYVHIGSLFMILFGC